MIDDASGRATRTDPRDDASAVHAPVRPRRDVQPRLALRGAPGGCETVLS